MIQALKDMSFGIHNFDYFRTRSMLITGSPAYLGQSEAKTKQKMKAKALTLSSMKISHLSMSIHSPTAGQIPTWNSPALSFRLPPSSKGLSYHKRSTSRCLDAAQ